MPRRVVRRLGRQLGRRGAILLCYGIVWSLIGYGQIAFPQPDLRGLTLLLYVMPLWGWGCLWVASGLTAIVFAFLPQGPDTPGFVALFIIVIPWVGSYLAAWWPLGMFDRGWIAAVVWSAIAAPLCVVVGWGEPARPKREEPPYGH